MADNTLLIGSVLVAAGIAGYEYVSHQNASAATGPQAAPAPTGFQPPDNLLQMMQGKWLVYGSPTADSNRWVQAMDSLAPSAGAGAWLYVWQQWYSIYVVTHAWPSNDQLKGWLKYAVDNGVSG